MSISIIYAPTMFFIKLSILLLYLRIFFINDRMRYLIYFKAAFLAVFYMMYLGVNIAYNFVCTAFNFQKVKYCLDFDDILYAQGATNLATDIWLVVLPIPMILRLKISKKQKIGLILILAAASL